MDALMINTARGVITGWLVVVVVVCLPAFHFVSDYSWNKSITTSVATAIGGIVGLSIVRRIKSG
jgi:hypothetical protein